MDILTVGTLSAGLFWGFVLLLGVLTIAELEAMFAAHRPERGHEKGYERFR